MSDYSNKLSSISEKKLKLIEEEKVLIERRKKEIGQLAQKFDLLTTSDDLIAGLFSLAKKAIAEKSDSVKEWETLGGRFRKRGNKPKPGKDVKAKISHSETAESTGSSG
jgi:hypothetical protein